MDKYFIIMLIHIYKEVYKMELTEVILAVIIGTLAAIVYSLILVEKRVASMEQNIQKLTSRVLKEETVIERALIKKRR